MTDAPAKHTFAVAVVLQQVAGAGLVTTLTLSVNHATTREEAIGMATEFARKAKPGFAIMDYLVHQVTGESASPTAGLTTH